ncbi:MAG: MarR family transcriptional regulator [Cyclobacteriaceae bacterium]|nr:MarR family transcriptional regulator [Cyclobacteriaceae bacterium]
MKREETVDFHIRAAWHAIARMYNQRAAEHDATMSMGFVLLNIDSELGTPATKIAPLMGLEARSLTRILKTLEERRIIERRADPNDKRSVRIFLTRDGRRRKEKARETVVRFNEAVRAVVPKSDLRVFFDVVQRINRVADREHGQHPQ